tara:strand:- start:6373 stop:7323 length:951 start_codon:yes stop_codon:yes gene_type:complete
MNILVTGGAGFIGSHLIDSLLKGGHFVVCLDCLSLGRENNIRHNLKNKNFQFIEMDVLNEDRLDNVFKKHKFQTIFHLVANSDIHAGIDDPGVDLRKTFLSTFIVLECMRKNSVKSIIFPSSQVIYGEKKGRVTEDTGPLFPVSIYGSAKLSSEAFISSYAALYGIQSWIIRFPNVTGGRATHGVVFDFINKLKKDSKKLVILGDGTQEKPYIFVEDLVEGILFIWKNADDSLNYFNIGPEDTTSVSRIAEITIEEMGLSSVSLEYTGGKGGWSGDVSKFRYDVSKINSLGWKTSFTSDEAVRAAVRAQLLHLEDV